MKERGLTPAQLPVRVQRVVQAGDDGVGIEQDRFVDTVPAVPNPPDAGVLRPLYRHDVHQNASPAGRPESVNLAVSFEGAPRLLGLAFPRDAAEVGILARIQRVAV